MLPLLDNKTPKLPLELLVDICKIESDELTEITMSSAGCSDGLLTNSSKSFISRYEAEQNAKCLLAKFSGHKNYEDLKTFLHAIGELI